MLTYESVLPSLKRYESITSHYENGGNYVRFTLKLRRFSSQSVRVDIYVSSDSKTLSIRYYYPEQVPEWAYERLNAFLGRMREHLLQSPEFRLRFATKAMNLDVTGFPDLFEDDNFEADITEMGVFGLGLLFGVTSLFELFGLLSIHLYGFLGLVSLVSLGAYYAYLQLSYEDLGKNKVWRVTKALLAFPVIVTAVSILSFIPFFLAWLIPYPLTFAGFILCTFGYSWVVSSWSKLSRLNEKYTSKY